MKNFIKRQIALREITKERKKELAITMRFANNKRTPLAPEEIKRAKDYWGDSHTSYKEHEVYKFFHGFDERFLGHELYLPLIARKLNDYKYTKFYENKNMTDLFKSDARFPRIIIRCVNSELY